MGRLYRLNEREREIILRSQKENNPNIFLNYYLRGENTGTYWRPVTEESDIPEIQEMINRWTRGYNKLREMWLSMGRPTLVVLNEKVHKVIIEADPDYPVFHYHHGFLLQDWQLEMHRNPAPTKVNISGYGSGKTVGELAEGLYYAATLPGWRGFALAPYSLQANEVHVQAKNLLRGTLYEERFLINAPTKPVVKLVIGNDLVGESTLECYPIGDDPEKVKTLSGDWAMVDQAEMIEDLSMVVEVVGSRFRGQTQGRERQGKLTFLANSEDNPQLWDMFDDAEHDEDIHAVSVTTFDNQYNTPRQLKLIEKRIKNDPNTKNQKLRGARPKGAGEHFPLDSISKIHATYLDEMMREHLLKETPGWKQVSKPKAGVVEWEAPPEEGHLYLMVADPGWKNPPERDSAVIGVWDVTNFYQQPAQLRAFSWVYGNGSPDPWLEKFYSYALKYNCAMRCAFDGTGLQKGYDRWVFALQEIHAEPLNLGGGNKFMFLNDAKVITSHGLLEVPDIPMLFSQMAKYKLPDEKLRQDLVMWLVMTCGVLQRRYYIQFAENAAKQEERTHPVQENRYDRPVKSRHIRRVTNKPKEIAK